MLNSMSTVYAAENINSEFNSNMENFEIENIYNDTISIQSGTEQGTITVTMRPNMYHMLKSKRL